MRISAQVTFEIVRLTPEEILTQKLWGSKFDGPKSCPDALRRIALESFSFLDSNKFRR